MPFRQKTKTGTNYSQVRAAVALSLLALCTTTHGFDEAGVGEDFLLDLPVVLTVTRMPQQAHKLPASVTVIDRQMIEASGAKEIPELLRLVAGFQVGHANLIGPRATVTYHGMSDHYARRMQVLVDGRSIYNAATGGVEWYGLPLVMDDIERIEVTRGPNGVTYGANSFLGVINILTYHPDELQGSMAKATAGDNGYRKGILRHAGENGALDYRISMEYQSDEGNGAYQDEAVDAIRDDKKIQSATVRADYRHSVNDYLTMQLGASGGAIGDGMVGDITQPLHENDTTQYYGQIKWKRIFSTDHDIELQFYQNYNNSDADYFIPKLSTLFSITPAEVLAFFGHVDDPLYVPHSHTMRRNNVEFVHRVKPADSMRLVWGAEARQEEMESVGLIGANSPVKNRLYRLFANTEWTPGDEWVINAGLMLEKNEITDTHISPRVAVNYNLGKTQSIRTSYSVNYRTPAMLEEYADYGARFYPDNQMVDQIWYGSGDLEPEKSTSYEVALVGTMQGGAVGYDIRVFRDHMRDLIATPINDAQIEPYSALCALYDSFCRATNLLNGGSVDLSGLELQARLQATDQTLFSLGYSHTNAKGVMIDRLNPDIYSSLELHVPTNTLSLLAEHKFNGDWQGSVGYYHLDSSSFIGGDETGGIKTTDVRVAKGIRMNGVEAKLSLLLQDVNGTYYDFSEDVKRKRSAYLSAEINF